jgi:hypothetical protein
MLRFKRESKFKQQFKVSCRMCKNSAANNFAEKKFEKHLIKHNKKSNLHFTPLPNNDLSDNLKVDYDLLKHLHTPKRSA